MCKLWSGNRSRKYNFEMEIQKNSQLDAASLGRELHKLLIVVGSDGLESGIGVCLAQIPTDSCIVSDTQSAINMCPSQIWKPRFPNVKIRKKGIFSVTITKISTFRAVFSISSLGHQSVEKTECDGEYNEEKMLFLRNV